MSLIEALQNKTPLVWVDVDEPERLIAQLPTLCEGRNLFVYDVLNGLMQWSYEDHEWKIVLIAVLDEELGEMVDTEIHSAMGAWGYVFNQTNATFILRNAHKDIDDNLTMFSSLFGHFRQAFWDDDDDKIPLQIISLVVDTPCPPELIAMSTIVKYGRPSRAEFTSLVSHFRTNYAEHDIIDGQDVDKILDSCLGMTEFEAIETMMRSIRTTGKIDAKMLNDLKFERMKARSDLDLSRPNVTLDDIGGLQNAKKLITDIQWMWENAEEAKRLKLPTLRRILLLGLAGTGKSLICKAAASSLKVDLAKAGVAKAMNRFVGQSEENMRSMFAQINALAPIAVWIDELGRDLSGGESSGYTDGGTTSRVHATFLTEMQELNENVCLFAAANNIASLPPEMLRAGRFDKLMFVGFPTMDERREIFKLLLVGREGDEDRFELDRLAAATPCFTGAEIEALIGRTRVDISLGTGNEISTLHLLSSVPKEKNRIWVRFKPLCMTMYASAIHEYEWASDQQLSEAGDIARGVEPRAVKLMPGVLK
jgi:AAA+ superfamily predicted ATPase